VFPLKIGIHNYYELFNCENAIFKPETYPIGENLEFPLICLRDSLNSLGHSLDTLDVFPLSEYDKVIFLDLPKISDKRFHDLVEKGKDLFLVIIESHLVKPENWEKRLHKFFKKVFTWNEEWVDNYKYFKLNISHKIPKDLDFASWEGRKFCVMISGNKKLVHPLELYSKRTEVVRWFENNYPGCFDLFGQGWEERRFPSDNWQKIFNRFEIFRKTLYKVPSSFRGTVMSKRAVLSDYKFSICFENAKDIPGYITEKIFDCFFAGSIPIYWGASNVLDIIPENCLIDMRRFKSFEELFEFLQKIDRDAFCAFQENIKNFLYGEGGFCFSGECFAETLISHLL